MKKIAIIADSHFDEHSRFDECVKVHSWIADDIAKRGVDLVLHAGDVFERRSTPRERQAVARFLASSAQVAPVVVVRGNHDAPGDLTLFESLASKHEIRVIEAAEVVKAAGCEIACLAWPNRANILAKMQGGRETAELAASDALKNIVRGLGQQFTSDGPRLFLAHAMVRGSMTSHGQPLVGCDFELGLEDLGAVEASLYALGHIHLGQAWDIPGAPVVYPGSPRRTAFGENETKCYVLATYEGSKLISLENIEVPCSRLLTIEAEWKDDAFAISEHPLVEGAEVRFRYHTDIEHRDESSRLAAEYAETLKELGAAKVKIEEKLEVVTRARLPEVSRARTIAEKMIAYWDSENMNTRRVERLAKLTQIEHALIVN